MDIIKLLDVNGGSAVKALCFHHKKAWIFAGFSTGMIQIWNYNTNTMLKEFEGHNGSVQSVDIHISCSLLVSAGSDGKINLWDYCDKTSNITKTMVLEGHKASVNYVQFHFDLPWIVSASDDHTVRLWNWKSCSCITVLSKHKAVVTSSSFHPKKDLVLSSSLDGTLCVWDIGALRDDTTKHNFTFTNGLATRRNGARLQYVLRGHKSGVAHAIFHPNLPLIISSSYDGSVYLWQMKGKIFKSYHHQRLHLQTKGFSHLAYSTKMNAVMYSEDDGNMFLFDASSKTGSKNVGFHIHQKKLFILATHPTKHIFAAGHANGISIYRTMKEPPGFATTESNIYYVKDKSLWSYNISGKKGAAEVVLGPMEDLPRPTLGPIVTTLTAFSLRPEGVLALVCVDNTTYKLVLSGNNSSDNVDKFEVVFAKGHGLSAVLLASHILAVLTQSGMEKILTVRNIANEVISKTVLPSDIQALFSHFSLGYLMLCKATDRVVMFDLKQECVVSELSISSVRNIFWGVGDKGTVIALVGNYFIAMANAKLELLCTVHETTYRIESGAWDNENTGVFVYKTLNEIRYCLVDGQSGTILTFTEPLLITKASGNTIYCLDEDEEVRIIAVDATEYVMKSSILNKDYMKQCCICLS